MLLAATEQMVFGTCIANIWGRPGQTMHAAAAKLAQAYPGRFALGLGVGSPEQAASIGQEFGSPLATMRDYLDRMDSPTWPPAPDTGYPRIIAANGPKCLHWRVKPRMEHFRPCCPRSSPRRLGSCWGRTSS
jgi:alkanesulfonate monooxygenase SsuD/methylene tetrahydromethanopterin reductase-like flavin-dependent oxidoreductase (luciferase family)